MNTIENKIEKKENNAMKITLLMITMLRIVLFSLSCANLLTFTRDSDFMD